MKVSVIVTAYNEEKYINRCLTSLANQTLTDGLEVIVIDDGSSDQTATICDEFQRDYSRLFRVFHRQNVGQGLARNFGVSVSRGDYIGFVDADDWVEPEMFAGLYQTAITNKADMVVCDVNKIYDWQHSETSLHSLPTASGSIDIAQYIEHGENNAYSWNKLYRRALWNHFQYRNMVYEDLDIILDMLTRCKVVSYVQKPYYHYFKHLGTTTTAYQNPRLYDIFTAYTQAIANAAPRYRDAVAYDVAKRILINLDTPGFAYYLADFFDLIHQLAPVFKASEPIMADPAISRILAYENAPTLPKNVICTTPAAAASWQAYGKNIHPLVFSTKPLTITDLLDKLYDQGGILSLSERQLASPFGYLRALNNFLLLDTHGHCIAIGAERHSQFVYALAHENLSNSSALDHVLHAIQSDGVWTHCLYNVRFISEDGTNLIQLKPIK